MPNWKKVIVSGSDAALNSLTVSNGITGSLQGTASFAISASWAPSAGGAAFPYTGSAIISGSLTVTGSINIKGPSTAATTASLLVQNSTTHSFAVFGDNKVKVYSSTANYTTDISNDGSYGNLGTNAIGNHIRMSNTSNDTLFTQAGFFSSGVEIKGSPWYGYVLNLDKGVYTADDYLRFGTGRINSSGSLGIGTTTPSASLHISGASSAALFKIESPAAPNILFVSGSGNVGIGTTAPVYKLDILGESRISGSLRINTGIINLTSNNNSYYQLGFQSGADFSIFNANYNRTDLFINQLTGVVGIGTITPNAKLDVSGSAIISGSITATGDITGSNAIFTGTITAQKLVVSTISSSILYSSGSNKFGNDLTNTHQFTGSLYQTGSTAAFMGNVGIATATPAYNLDINGTARVAGSGNSLVINSTTNTPMLTFTGYYTNGAINISNNNMSLTPNLLLGGNATVISIAGTTRTSTGVYTGIDISMNYSASAIATGSGQYRGMYYNPTVSMPSSLLFNRAIETTSGDVLFQSGSAPLFFVSGSGNVGIGTTTPNAKLDVVGSLMISASSGFAIDATYANYPIASNSGTNGGFVVTSYNSSLRQNRLTLYNSACIEGDYNTNTGSLSFKPNVGGPTNLFISSSGNVGIGTTAPLYKLDVSGSGRFTSDVNITGSVIASNSITGGSTTISGNQINFGNSAGIIALSSTQLQIGTSAATTSILFMNNSTTSASLLLGGTTNLFPMIKRNAAAIDFRLADDSGYANINAGSITASGSLTVTGSMVFTGDITGSNALFTGTITAQKLVVQTVTSSILYSSGSNIFGSQLTDVQSFTGSLRVTGSGNHWIMGGNVGIGTTTPAYKLDVNGIARIGDQSTSGQLYIKGASGTGQYIYLDNGSGNTVWSIVGGSSYTIQQDGTSRIAISAAGNVGIGTITPTYKLEVSGSNTKFNNSSGNFELDIVSSTTSGRITAGSTLFALGSLTTAPVVFWMNATEKMRIHTNSNVGIGTTTPAYKLDVSGSGRFTDGINVTGSMAFTGDITGSNALFTGTITAQKLVVQTITSSVLYSSGSNQFGSQLTDVQSFTGSLRVTGSGNHWVMGGNVGIGTITPSASLHISGAAATPLLRISNPASVDFIIKSDSTLTDYTGLYWGTDYKFLSKQSATLFINAENNISFANGLAAKTTMNSNGQLGIGVGSAASILATAHIKGIGSGSATTSLLVQNSTTSASLAVLDNGFVGIRTTAPSASLHVAGTTILSSSFNTAISGSTLKVQGSGSALPIFTVVGSQGELFSITDSLSGSLFSVNDISGLPILEVFSDNTILLGNYQAPTLYTTNKIASTALGSNVIYSFPTSSYDGVFMDYTVKSGSNARAGNFAAIWSGTAVNYMDNSTTDFGSTAGMVLSGSISGSNLVVFASGSSAGWTFKGIIKAI